MNGICLCQPGFEGLACQFRKRDCPELCQHGGTCINGTCYCLAGYLGEFCEIRPVECIPSCINGGFCNSGVCICPDGYTGPSCEVSVGSQPQIVVTPFQAQVLALGEDTTIQCNVRSRDVDESPSWYTPNGTLINTLANGGTGHKHVSVIDDQNIELVINDFQIHDVGNYSCTAGPLSRTITLMILPITCSHPCLNGGHCQNGVCVCAEDYYGEFCELSNFTDTYIPCEPQCENGATCVQGLCLCPLGYRGDTCSEEMSCDPMCENNAVCVLGYCRCPVGFTGSTCNEDINECEINPTICKHDCFNTIGSFYCSCAPGYRLTADRKCVDIDECEGEHNCEQRCLNIIGSYLCACYEGSILEADGNTCVGPTGCVYENHLYPSGTTWTVDGCTECSCDLGVTTCTDCPTPKFQQCTYQGIEYDHSTNWTSPFDPCDHCNCTDGQVKCMREICDIQCDYPAPHQTECCHECTDCLYEGNVIRNHLYFSPMSQQCTTCICQDGNVRCSNVSCPEIDCSRPVQGECCLTCEDNCEFQGSEYQDGETFTAESLDCSVCTCKASVVECRPFDCPALNCSRNERVQLPGDCCPKCISAVPGCVDKYGLLHQYETTWTDPRDNCLTCTCLNTGEVQCAREQCEFNCNNPVHVRGQCCPDCNGCYYNGIGFSYGATFKSAFDKCDSCICLGGDVICEPTSCNVQCSAPYHPPGECCPLCEDCYFLGQIIPDGEYFNPALDSCKTCHCDKGSVQCTEREQCPMLNCPVTTTVAGECCPSCADAFCRGDDGSEHRSGDTWISSSDPCQECTCLDTIINCVPVPCLESSSCTHGVQIEGVCCPDCTVCEFEGNLYRNGSSFTPSDANCRKCQCINGNVMCEDETCPPIYCMETVQAFGQCCPQCAVCTAQDGTIYSHGQTWQDGEDPCTTCRCINTEIECNTPICPIRNCIDPQFDFGECCASCEGCTFENTNYTNGQTFSPATQDCMECVCQDDRLNCQPITCPIPDCPAESVVYRDGACCPDCVDPEVSRMTCQIDDVILESGSSHQPDECSTCLCMAGELLCEAPECVDIGCPQIRQVRAPGSCCPECKLDACVFDGRLVLNNEVFIPMGDSCTNCSCSDGAVTCRSVSLSCPSLDCPPEDQVKEEGDCCKHCAGALQLNKLPCTFQGETIPAGGSFMIGCQECRCEGGNPRCSRRECPVLNCLGGEEIQMAPDGCCEECVPKMGSCIVFGDPHYRTFDKRFHDFQGTCTYTLSKDCTTNQFEIIVQNNGKETYAVSWTELVSFKVHNMTIDLLPNFAVRLNKEEITLPYLNEPEFSIQKLGLMIVVHTNIGISLSWDGAHFAEVVADGIWEGQLCGLCGDYNGNPDDDFRASNGTLCGTASEFGNTFLVGDYAECSCQESIEQTPCLRNDNADMEFMARDRCSILKEEPFAAAHALVPPLPFFDACMYDLCACPAHERCLCDVLTAYSHEARKKGIMIDWQRDNYCAISCPEGAVYNECTSPCVQTCDTVNTIEDSLECNQLENCIPGCRCPAGMVLHDFRCMMPEDCPL
nr:kielin/chordin-like protein [Lytechinus pictus]